MEPELESALEILAKEDFIPLGDLERSSKTARDYTEEGDLVVTKPDAFLDAHVKKHGDKRYSITFNLISANPYQTYALSLGIMQEAMWVGDAVYAGYVKLTNDEHCAMAVYRLEIDGNKSKEQIAESISNAIIKGYEYISKYTIKSRDTE